MHKKGQAKLRVLQLTKIDSVNLAVAALDCQPVALISGCKPWPTGRLPSTVWIMPSTERPSITACREIENRQNITRQEFWIADRQSEWVTRCYPIRSLELWSHPILQNVLVGYSLQYLQSIDKTSARG